MTRFIVNLNYKPIPDYSEVYMARAGAGAHMFDQVLAHRAIGPDLPNLNLDLTHGFENEINLKEKIIRARNLSDRIRNKVVKDDHSRREYSQLERVVRAFFHDIEEGDVFVIPSSNKDFFGNAILAEALPLETSEYRLPGSEKFRDYWFQSRKFGHYSQKRKLDLPQDVLKSVRNRSPLDKISDLSVRKEIFEMCYTEFKFRDEFTSQIFTTKSELRLVDMNVLSAFVLMVERNIELMRMGANLQGLAASAFEIDSGLDIKINTNSPIRFLIKSVSLTSLVVIAFFKVLADTDFDIHIGDRTNIEIVVNNAMVDNGAVNIALEQCNIEVSEITQNLLRLMPEDEFQEMCRLLRETHGVTGATNNASVEREE